MKFPFLSYFCASSILLVYLKHGNLLRTQLVLIPHITFPILLILTTLWSSFSLVYTNLLDAKI